jgi:hypothetical protein
MNFKSIEIIHLPFKQQSIQTNEKKEYKPHEVNCFIFHIIRNTKLLHHFQLNKVKILRMTTVE